MFRVTPDQAGFDADTLDQAREALQRKNPGRYDVYEIRAEPFPSDLTSRQWGRLIRHPDGRVVDEPWAWVN
jgi:hypothetical protein